MALIKSISGIRGTIGGNVGDNLTAQDIVECAAAFGHWVKQKTGNPKIVIGRDGRISGEIVNQLVVNAIRMVGVDVVDLGLSTTPTVEIAVPEEQAGAGIIITASHNPKQWNALKFLNDKGEFISGQDGSDVLQLIEDKAIDYVGVDSLGSYEYKDGYIQKHIESVFGLELVNTEVIKARQFKVVVDCINSTGSLSVIPMLEQLGCEVIGLNDTPNGEFAHNPEPLADHLIELSKTVESTRADLGIAIDPDVDRLAFVCEDGEMFGEEYTLVAIADYILQHKKGNTVSNLSSTRALRDVTEKHGGVYHAAAVGEVNVVTQMKAVNAVIGGEGNGGVIYPDSHYGRDALAGIGLFLTHLANFGKPVSFLRSTYPNYVISKNKIQLTPDIDVDHLLVKLEEKYKNQPHTTIDGLKVEFDKDWIHLRKSNTEPIIRIYAESTSAVMANNLANKIKSDVKDILQGS
ncbi:MAG: phosphoglucosamine mutase [Saprospiraceae bacterium]